MVDRDNEEIEKLVKRIEQLEADVRQVAGRKEWKSTPRRPRNIRTAPIKR